MTTIRRVWAWVRERFTPKVETYETRKPRPGEPELLGRQYAHEADQRRDGGTLAIG